MPGHQPRDSAELHAHSGHVTSSSLEQSTTDPNSGHFRDETEKLDLPHSTEDVIPQDLQVSRAEGDEAESLLATSDRESKRQRRRKKKLHNAKTEVMYEVDEERGQRRKESSDESLAGEGEDEDDIRRLKTAQAGLKKKRRTSWRGFAVIHVLIMFAFLALLYGAWVASRQQAGKVTSSHKSVAKTLSNGTRTFAPTTLLISLDGFRADFLARNLTPTLSGFIRRGVSPKYMLPSFPSLTFPNHFTLATGHYPESHGIVGNTFWDPVTEGEFYYTDPHSSMQPKWWNAEPIWMTAELAGVRSAIHMWPGSEAHIGGVDTSYVDKFNMDEPLNSKVDRVLGWLDLPGPEDENAKEGQPRPQLIAMYVPNVDTDGHKFGPNSTYIRSTIKEVDGMLGMIFKGIDERNLTNIVNIIVVSDHGMATTSTKRLLQLEDLVDVSLVEHTDGWPLYGLRPYDRSPSNLQKLYNGLKEKSTLPQYRGKFEVYLRDENMPPRFHFSANERIAPLWIVPRTGWAIVVKDEFKVASAQEQNLVYHPKGLHGYDHEHPLMRAIFVARGPAFEHLPGSEIDIFQNTEVYNIVCDSLGIEPKPNNGTLRLPFIPSGQYDFDAGMDVPEDLSEDDDGTNVVAASEKEEKQSEEPPSEIEDSKVDEKENSVKWWDWIKGRIEVMKGWASTLVGSHHKANNGTEKGERSRRAVIKAQVGLG